jgi:RNA polymerase sigma-70 factor (ECF subfamily)
MTPPDPEPRPVAGFATTRWSLVSAARASGADRSRAALEMLCSLYWPPLYAYIRHQGHNADQAQDLTQEFFARLLEKDGLSRVDQGRGRFRSFLLAACRHFLSNQRDHDHALKRGGDRRFLPIDPASAEAAWGTEPADRETPERLFERRWALTLLDHVLAGLRREYEEAGKGPLFESLKGHLTGDACSPHAETAAQLGLSEGAVKVAVHRLRQRYRDRLREEIAQTLDDPADVEDEIRALFQAFGS